MSTYLDYYNENFAPSLKAIDLFLKTKTASSFSIDVVSELLDLSADEIKSLMKGIGIDILDRVSFFTIMQYGSSPVCRLFSRELQRKLPTSYSFQDVSYIYQIPYDQIVEAAQKADISVITNQNIHTLFSNIILVC
ncbi:MAG: hypothetical protein CVU84_11470 [Firmicutes bacterium HGW-Firmicutes-1]|jgi:hypothetical protein|nr:MAG: hypothetical protein CVU84_11470 [Firmicutes bacterium HGW-Firmicutes-1]